MDKLIKGSLIICSLLWSFTTYAQETTTVSGEVLDLSCYMANGAKGPDHAQCAKACAKKGQPIGLLTADGTVFLLGAGEDGAQFDAVKELAGEMAEITGKQSERDGIKMVVVGEAKKAGS